MFRNPGKVAEIKYQGKLVGWILENRNPFGKSHWGILGYMKAPDEIKPYFKKVSGKAYHSLKQAKAQWEKYVR